MISLHTESRTTRLVSPSIPTRALQSHVHPKSSRSSLPSPSPYSKGRCSLRSHTSIALRNCNALQGHVVSSVPSEPATGS